MGKKRKGEEIKNGGKVYEIEKYLNKKFQVLVG